MSGGGAVGQAGRFKFYSLVVHNTPTTQQHQALKSEYTSICYSEVSGGGAVGQAGRFIFYSLLVHNTPTTHQHQALNIQVYATARRVAAEL